MQPGEALESERIEFKAYKDQRALHNSKDLAEELSALANRSGGVVIVGVRDSSDVAHGDWGAQLQGIESVDLLETKGRIAGKLKPSVNLTLREIIYSGKTYLAIDIEQSYESLVSTASGKTCIGYGRSSRPMSPDEIERAVKSLAHYDWSNDYPDESETIELDEESMNEAREDFIQRREMSDPASRMDYLEAIGATQNGVITRGGLKIHSPGAFFGGVTSDNIALHEPRHRNKNLARILMIHNLVDRAGMGVLRMGLGSLRYGRAFPEFREQSDAVEVKMAAKNLRPGVAVLGIENRETWGTP